MYKKVIISSALVGLLFGDCASMQAAGDLVNSTGELISSTGKLITGQPLGTATNSRNQGGVNEQDISKMTQVKNNVMLKNMISEAKPNIQSALSLLACSKTSDVYLSRAGRYATSKCNTVYGGLGGLYGMNNNTSRCANIVRINNYTVKAKNSF